MSLINEIKKQKQKQTMVTFRCTVAMKQALKIACRKHNVRQGTVMRSMIERFLKETL
jgi:hypothetical protein